MRVSDCPHLIESRAFRANAHLERMPCLSCGDRLSRTTGPDDILSCDDDVWLREQATMNRVQHRLVEAQLEQFHSQSRFQDSTITTRVKG